MSQERSPRGTGMERSLYFDDLCPTQRLVIAWYNDVTAVPTREVPLIVSSTKFMLRCEHSTTLQSDRGKALLKNLYPADLLRFPRDNQLSAASSVQLL